MTEKTILASEFIDKFDDFKSEDHVLIDFGTEQSLAVKVHPVGNRDSKALVVLFHGAISRKPENQTVLPAFLNARRELGDSAIQISIADPSIREDNSVGIGWFAGNEELPLQQLLPGFLENLASGLGIDRVILHGSSAGGFGALYYSWQLAGSAACVSVPQTSAFAYNPGTLKNYLSSCWPNTRPENLPVLDLKPLYSETVPNFVSYIQSSRDGHHVSKHMIPFLASIAPEEYEKVSLKVSYWGKEGHSGSVPPEERDGWIKAAIVADNVTSFDVVNAYQKSGTEITPLSQAMMRAAGVSKQPRKGKQDGRSQQEQFQDLNWAEIVTNHQRERF
ncbi:hypothetical protein [Corynebacterium casei]|uniref:hypothetical protein n=1 Tax=Corynebacterium casei TaxID=160386 RepID=UPI003FD47D6A